MGCSNSTLRLLYRTNNKLSAEVYKALIAAHSSRTRDDLWSLNKLSAGVFLNSPAEVQLNAIKVNQNDCIASEDLLNRYCVEQVIRPLLVDVCNQKNLDPATLSPETTEKVPLCPSTPQPFSSLLTAPIDNWCTNAHVYPATDFQVLRIACNENHRA